jgi:hypothetical protein
MAAEACSLGAAAVKGVRQFVRLFSAATPSNSRKRSTLDEDDHGQGRCEDFLQGLGKGPADRLLR